MRSKILIITLFITACFSCNKDSKDVNTPVLRLTPDEVRGKSGKSVEATLYITAPNGVKDIVMYKTINLVRDNMFGNGGLLTATPVSLGNNQYKFDFSYMLQDEEIDKLVGINFRVTDDNGLASEKDLTVHTTTSGRTILYSRKWKLISRIWTSVTPSVEDLKTCETDNIYSWFEDSTYNVSFGSDTGAGDCMFDGFNVFDAWTLSDDEKTFSQKYHSLFNPDDITIETFTVKELTSEKFVVEQIVDLSWLGAPYTDKEKFVSTFVPVP